MKVALGQFNATIGDFSGNLEKILGMIAQAEKGGAELIVFPELAVSGYPPRDLLEKKHFIDSNLEVLQALLPASRRIGILIGHIARNEQHGEKSLLNAASFITDERIQLTYAKRLLPTYDVFDEERYFACGKVPGYFEFGGLRFGVTICEDIWNDKRYWEDPKYSIDPVAELVEQRVTHILNLSASPYGWDKEAVRLEMIRAIAKRYERPVYFCNLVGGNDELVFDGRSTVVNSGGQVVAEAACFEDDLLLVDDVETLPEAQIDLERDQRETILKALSLGVHDYVTKCGFTKVVLGLSGGVDSALVLKIAVEALGAENVDALIMPSRYTSSETLSDAKQLAEHLGITHHVISIEPIFEAYLTSLREVFGASTPDTTEENIQARIRGNLLMAYSNKYGHLLLSTGNKSELSVGYCTLYGDMSGGLAVISDIPKTLVYELCEWINREREEIPQRILTRPPSAELRPDQKDQDSLPPYSVLDPILKAYIEDHQSRESIIAMGNDASIVDEVIRRIVQNEYKRQQMPIGIKVSKKAFGMGRRLPLAKK